MGCGQSKANTIKPISKNDAKLHEPLALLGNSSPPKTGGCTEDVKNLLQKQNEVLEQIKVQMRQQNEINEAILRQLNGLKENKKSYMEESFQLNKRKSTGTIQQNDVINNSICNTSRASKHARQGSIEVDRKNSNSTFRKRCMTLKDSKIDSIKVNGEQIDMRIPFPRYSSATPNFKGPDIGRSRINTLNKYPSKKTINLSNGSRRNSQCPQSEISQSMVVQVKKIVEKYTLIRRMRSIIYNAQTGAQIGVYQIQAKEAASSSHLLKPFDLKR